jgi:hypothetical protein
VKTTGRTYRSSEMLTTDWRDSGSNSATMSLAKPTPASPFHNGPYLRPLGLR